MAKKKVKVPVTGFKKSALKTGISLKFESLEQKHQTFSHIMYILFLISVTFATYYTFQALQVLGSMEKPEYFYVVLGILMLLWSFLFWEFGHRIHD